SLESTPPTILAALGDMMLNLSGAQTAGAHPYLIPVAHTAKARRVLGDSALLAPEQAAIIGDDLTVMMKVARAHLARYLVLPNYTNNLKRLGFSAEEFENGGSDALVKALYAIGTVEQVAERVHQHLSAGADHVAVQLLQPQMNIFPKESWKKLVPALRELESEKYERQPKPIIEPKLWIQEHGKHF
ncbi:MAG: hypothetical protein OEZ23_03255, partial [Gammaproteobacteria bacterium]|nr:hypothetical protein [Gammaproteobacteria bacterium]